MPLRVASNARFIRFPGLFKRYGVQTGKRQIFYTRWKKDQMQLILEYHTERPICLVTDEPRQLWYFHGRFYWDDENLGWQDVNALLLQRERRSAQRIQSARSMMNAEASGRRSRAPIPRDLRRAVYERDGGRCTECGATFDLQYDHIIPVALGGATTLQNLQLLCAPCNVAKSDSL